jgi:hypothetical protein
MMSESEKRKAIREYLLKEAALYRASEARCRGIGNAPGAELDNVVAGQLELMAKRLALPCTHERQEWRERRLPCADPDCAEGNPGTHYLVKGEGGTQDLIFKRMGILQTGAPIAFTWERVRS